MNKKVILKWARIISGVTAMLLITQYILMPMIINLLDSFIGLVGLYSLLEAPHTFYGGFLFLFVLWKLFSGVVQLIVMLANWVTEKKEGED